MIEWFAVRNTSGETLVVIVPGEVSPVLILSISYRLPDLLHYLLCISTRIMTNYT